MDTPTPPPPQDLSLLLAAQALRDLLPSNLARSNLGDLALTLSSQLLDPDARDIDDRLATQARLLDTLFSSFVANGLSPKHYDLQCLAFALKAQQQCRTSINAFHRTKGLRRLAGRTAQADMKKAANEMKKLLK